MAAEQKPLDLKNMFTRSLMGNQPLGKWKSSPSFGFGTGSRDTREKVFISMAHVKGIFGRHSPGPAMYGLPSASGPQLLSNIPSQPRWAFGQAKRFPVSKLEQSPGPGAYTIGSAMGRQITSRYKTQPIHGFGSAEQRANWKIFISQEHNLAFYGREGPGPLAYPPRSTMGKQELSTLRSSPSISFGTADRSGLANNLKRAAASPGPASYTLDAAIGKQVLSTIKSVPAPTFGKGSQMHNHKIYINEEINKSFYGRDGPGPTTSTQMPGFYRQPLSRNRTAPQWGFGSAPRFRENKLEVRPGPGHYCV
mmetsp:Transcript_24718/g.67245  ORF Transcript_24718/g.67245 Transcript_24718/m.67245 type:complete len:308 (-) Transcript_24718:103-1026(-)